VPEAISHKINTQKKLQENNSCSFFYKIEITNPCGHGLKIHSIGKLLKLENHPKKSNFTVFRNIPELKEVTFKNRYKTICLFISVFGINLYI
jgi:hypothetical protein